MLAHPWRQHLMGSWFTVLEANTLIGAFFLTSLDWVFQMNSLVTQSTTTVSLQFEEKCIPLFLKGEIPALLKNSGSFAISLNKAVCQTIGFTVTFSGNVTILCNYSSKLYWRYLHTYAVTSVISLLTLCVQIPRYKEWITWLNSTFGYAFSSLITVILCSFI